MDLACAFASPCSAMPVSSPRRHGQADVPPRWMSAVIRARRASSWRPLSSRAWRAGAWTCCGSASYPPAAVAHLTGALGADLGVMLSASHNPAPDNGIKFLARRLKLPDSVEDAIERRLGDIAQDAPPAAGFGRVTDQPCARERYLEHLVSSLQGSGAGWSNTAVHSTGQPEGASPLAGLRVVVDCAHGAAHDAAPAALRKAAADVIVIGAQPDGLNINEG